MKTDPKNYKPGNYEELVAKYRKVVPPDLTLDSGSGQNARYEVRSATGTLSPYNGAWDRSASAHLLRRTLFGIKKEELEHFSQLTMSQAVDELLQTGTIDPPINDYTGWDELPPDPNVAEGAPWHEAPYGEEYEGPRTLSLKGWVVKNILNQESTIHQKMILFWHNLLPIQSWDVFYSRASYQYYQMLSENSLGNFKELIRNLTLDPAMLLFLNGAFNNKDAPDENYARELQELFTLGKGPNSQYTEEDVASAARVLTGWTLYWDDFGESGRQRTAFYADAHDTGDKQFSSFFNNKIIKGKTGQSGTEETDELLDMIFESTEVAKYICRRIYNFFVFSEVDEFAETNIIEPLADLFRESNYEILPVIRELLQSEHFYDTQNIGSQIKSPVDMLLGSIRTLGIKNPYSSDLRVELLFNSARLWEMSAWGMELADPPSVSGWPAYYQAPQFDKSWITTDTITKRAIQTDAITYWGLWVYDGLEIPADYVEFLKTFDNPEDVNKVIKESSELLLGTSLQQESRDQLKEILLSGQTNEAYWTNAWETYLGDPSESNKNVIENRLKPMFQHLLQTGEFQLT